MEENIKELLKDYYRKLTVINSLMIDENYDRARNLRLRTKRNCYAKFINDLERLL